MGRLIDLTGKTYGRLTVTGKAESKDNFVYWHCKCECGKTKTVRGLSLKRGDTRSCGCLSSESSRERRLGKIIDLTGQRFGRLMVINCAGRDRATRWLCKCDCGNLKVIDSSNLRGSTTQSCGCLAVEVSTKHGQYGTSTYKSWSSMIYRCTNPNSISYKNYAGRGIEICQQWRNSFENFLADMGTRPAGHSIDRINNDDGYHCGHCEDCQRHGWIANCRWATAKEQANNQRKRRKA